MAAAGVVLCLSLITHTAFSLSTDSVVSELSVRQSQSPSGVIHLTDELLRRILSLSTPRPFHFIIFFDAHKLHSNPEIFLPTLKAEFSLISASFLSNNPDKNSSLFFFEIELEESRASFELVGVISLPHIRLIPTSATNPKTDSVKLELTDSAQFTEAMVKFIQSRTKLTVGPINRPPLISKSQIVMISGIALATTPFVVKKWIDGKTIFHKKRLWMASAVLVYFFSVSGGMFNIIRKIPMMAADRSGKVVFFYRGSGMQLGAEGFSIGFLYTIVGVLLGLQCHVVVRMKNRKLQRLVMIGILIVSVFAVKKVVVLSNWKSGYHPRAYWPSIWR